MKSVFAYTSLCLTASLCLGGAKLSAKSLVADKPLSIAFVVDSVDNPKSGGIVTAGRFIKKLREHHHVYVLSAGSSHNDLDRQELKSYYFPFMKKRMLQNGASFAHASRKTLRETFKKVDLVYVHLPYRLGQKAVQVAKSLGKPVVAGFHVQAENILLNAGIQSPALSHLIYRYFIKSFYNRADTVICPSRFAANILESHPSFQSKTEVVSNGIDSQFRPQVQDPFPEYKNRFVILSVGRLSAEKRHKTVIAAIAKSQYKNKIQLVITGAGPLKAKVRRMASKLPLASKIDFVSKKDLLRLYAHSDLYIHASAVELEGMSVLEAIGSGLPALISDSKTSASKQFALNSDMLFPHDNCDVLAKKIDYWIEHPKELKSAGRAYAKSANKYQFQASADKMEQIFYRTIKAKQKAAS